MHSGVRKMGRFVKLYYNHGALKEIAIQYIDG